MSRLECGPTGSCCNSSLSPADTVAAEAAFAALVDRHGPIVYRVCLDVLGSPHEAEDAAQAVFLVLARKARSIRKPDSLGPWLHGVALRVARHARREAARRRAAERNKAKIIRQRETAEPGPEPMDYAELHEEIDRLPDKYRRPIILCYMQGQTQAQAAQTLNWPLGTVQIRLHRGRERLRSRLTAERRPVRPDKTPIWRLRSRSQPACSARLDRDDRARRGPVRRRSRDGRAGRAAGERPGRVRACAMFAHSLKVFSLLVITLFSAPLVFTGRSRGPMKFTKAVRNWNPSWRQLHHESDANAESGDSEWVGLIANKTDQKAGQSPAEAAGKHAMSTDTVKATPTPVLLPRADPVDEVALLKSPAVTRPIPESGRGRWSSEKCWRWDASCSRESG